MRAITVRLPQQPASCQVETSELNAWASALLDEVLFALARQVSDSPDTEAAVNIAFKARALDDGNLSVEW